MTTRAAAAPHPDLVTIVIPVFNGARYVGAAIESALAQTWPALEVIVVNDGSDDGGATERMLARFGDTIRVIVKPNGGVATALNAGIAAMRGSWFSWLSHDDLYHPLKIERYMDALKGATGLAVAFGDVDLVDEEARLLRRVEFTGAFSPDDDPRWNVLEGRLNGCAMLVPRACLDVCGPFDPGLPTTQDYAYWFELAGRYPFVPVRESLVRSRVHAEQGSRHARHLEEASLLWATMLERFDREQPAASPVERLRRLRRVLKFLRHSSYAGARSYVESRIDALVAEIPIALVCEADGRASAAAALGTLAAAGGQCHELVLVDRTDTATAAIREDAIRWSPPTTTIRLPGAAAQPANTLAAVLANSTAPLLVCLDSSAPVQPSALHEGLAAVAAGETDGWLAGAATRPEHEWLGPLCGSVLDRNVISKAVRYGDQAVPMLGLQARLTMATPVLAPTPPAALDQNCPVVRGTHELFLAAPMRTTRPTLLILVHNWGGGTIRYAEIVAGLVKDRVNVLYGRGVDDRRFFLSSVNAEIAETEYDLTTQLDTLVRDLKSLGVGRVDVMHSVGFDRHLDEFLDRLGVPFDVTLLDYHHFAMQPHLVDGSGHFVGDDALADSDHPLLRRGPLPARLRAADRLIACSRDLAGRLQRLAPNLTVIAAKLPEPGNPERFATHEPALPPGTEMRVICLGRIASHKGAALIAGVAELLRQRRLHIRIDCLGAIGVPAPIDALLNPHLRLLGSYPQDQLNPLVCRLRPHLAWLPFTAPETHSFALSQAMLQGLPVLATGIGAIVERLEGRPRSWVMSPAEASPEEIVDWLERLQRSGLAMPPRWLRTSHLPPQTVGFYQREYLRPLVAS